MNFKTEQSKNKALSKLQIGRDLTIKNGLLSENKYNKHPKHCFLCYKVISYKQRKNKFCSKHCSVIYTNLHREKRNKKQRYCKNCKKLIKSKNSKYCNKKCFWKYNNKRLYNKHYFYFINGKMNDNMARWFFRKINKKQCSICRKKKWNGKEIPLVVDHIDGNHKNNFPNNLRFICCNCDAQLPTYKGANKGKGRKIRRKNYHT